jgi:hypothetical protein
MQVIDKRIGTTDSGVDYGLLVVRPDGNIRPAKRTSREAFLGHKGSIKNKKSIKGTRR